MIVVKIGGSLYSSSHLSEWINQIVKAGKQRIVIVPGGGPFADHIRDTDQQFGLSAECSHDMAVLAMQQFGRMMCDLNRSLELVHTAEELKTISSSAVWAPYQLVSRHCPYPKNWQTSADSLSVWLASYINASHLCLVKSAQINPDHDEAISSDLVDDYFATALSEYQGALHFYHASEASVFTRHCENGYFK